MVWNSVVSHNCTVLSQEEHFGRGLKRMFAKGMEVVQKWVSKDCKDGSDRDRWENWSGQRKRKEPRM